MLHSPRDEYENQTSLRRDHAEVLVFWYAFRAKVSLCAVYTAAHELEMPKKQHRGRRILASVAPCRHMLVKKHNGRVESCRSKPCSRLASRASARQHVSCGLGCGSDESVPHDVVVQSRCPVRDAGASHTGRTHVGEDATERRFSALWPRCQPRPPRVPESGNDRRRSPVFPIKSRFSSICFEAIWHATSSATRLGTTTRRLSR